MPCFIASVEGCVLAYTLHWVAYTSTENHCQDYGTQIEVGWHDLFIAMVKAKPSKNSDRQADSSSALDHFPLAPGLRTLVSWFLIGRPRAVVESAQICCHGWYGFFFARFHTILSMLQWAHFRNKQFTICCGIAASMFCSVFLFYGLCCVW